MSYQDIDKHILELSLKALAEQLNTLVADCTDDTGKPQKPSQKVLMQSKASLPRSGFTVQ